MSLRKSELEQINARLQEALRLVSAENAVLLEENQRLRRSLAGLNAQCTRLTRRYRRLTAYIRRLTAWARGQRS
jgi:hypothetical protein